MSGGTQQDTVNTSPFAAPGFTATYAVGVVWSLCRWAIGFLGAYVATETTGSPRLVQLTGALLWAPLLFAGAFGGAVSDRFSRRALLLGQFGILGPLTAIVGLLAFADRLPLWVLYGYMLMAGFGWVVDLTVRRALIYDLVGDGNVDRAMAFEGLASSVGLIVGAIGGGLLIALFGAGGAYLGVAGAIAVAAFLLNFVPPTPRPIKDPDEPRRSFANEIAEGFRLVAKWPVVGSILGVTALTNFFHFTYFPIVPVIAEQVAASPFTTGLLASATGMGMAVGALVVLRGGIPRGPMYAVGAAGAFVFLIGFGAFDSYPLIFVSLFFASCFVGLFAATQSVLVMTSVDAEVRGRAMGLLAMAIGMLPVGMTVLGELAEWVGPGTALIISNVTGLVCMAAFLLRRPQVLTIK